MIKHYPNDERPLHVMVVFGTRPETIKLAPVIRHLQLYSEIKTTVVFSGQHRHLVEPLLKLFKVDVDITLNVMKQGQSLNELLSNVLRELDQVLIELRPDLVVVQGDTTTALGGAMAAFQQKIAVGHVEAGLRTNDAMIPFPEEMNRRLISRLASLHFAATIENKKQLLRERIPSESIFLTGNPVVDALQHIDTMCPVTPALKALLDETAGYKRIVLTTHRRESFGAVLEGNLHVLANFVEEHEEAVLIFPVHPNPIVKAAARDILGNHERIRLIDPLDYSDFITLLNHAWLICSDSGGIQEEAPSLGKRVIVLREETERPEAVASGYAVLAGTPEQFADALESVYPNADVALSAGDNPFGNGNAGQLIVEAIRKTLLAPARAMTEASNAQ